jgi:hypothetical protein
MTSALHHHATVTRVPRSGRQASPLPSCSRTAFPLAGDNVPVVRTCFLIFTVLPGCVISRSDPRSTFCFILRSPGSSKEEARESSETKRKDPACSWPLATLCSGPSHRRSELSPVPRCLRDCESSYIAGLRQMHSVAWAMIVSRHANVGDKLRRYKDPGLFAPLAFLA